MYANMCSTRSHYSQQKETAAEKQNGPTNRPTNNGTPEKPATPVHVKRNQKNKTDKHTQTRQPAVASQRIITSLSLSLMQSEFLPSPLVVVAGCCLLGQLVTRTCTRCMCAKELLLPLDYSFKKKSGDPKNHLSKSLDL